MAAPPETPATKRSQTVSLVLLVGAAAAAFALAHVDPSQREEDALVYPDEGACVSDARRSAEDCHTASEAAREAYPRIAPRYATNAECETHHGAGGCTAGGFVAPEAAGFFIPVMAGYLVGRTAAQALPVQPLYRHAPDPEERGASGSSGGGYCTSSGGRVWAASGGNASSARVASSTARSVPTGARVVARGGLGGTGRAVASVGHSMSSGHGGSGGHASAGG